MELDSHSPGNTPLLLAVKNRKISLMQKLLDVKSDPLIKDFQGLTIIEYAEKNRYSLEVINSLKDAAEKLRIHTLKSMSLLYFGLPRIKDSKIIPPDKKKNPELFDQEVFRGSFRLAGVIVPKKKNKAADNAEDKDDLSPDKPHLPKKNG